MHGLPAFFSSVIFRPLFVLLCALALTLPAAGQNAPSGVISGRVVSGETGEVLPGASIAVWLPADSTIVTGALSGADGRFEVENIPFGTYRAVVSFISFRDEVFEDVRIGGGQPSVDLGTVTLLVETAQLAGVEVTAERQRVEMEIDRTVYNVTDDPLMEGGSATDVLGTLPSIEIGFDGQVSLRGSGSVEILINGRPAPVSAEFLAAYLQGLPAGVLERIEVLPNPSARFDATGAGGVINIVLKENVDIGLGASITTGADTRGGYNTTLTGTYGRGPLNLSAAYGLRRNTRDSEVARYRINRYVEPATYLNQSNVDARVRNSHLLQFTGDLAVSRRTSIITNVQLGLRSQTEDERTVYEQLDASQLPMRSYERLSDGNGSGLNGDLRLGLRHSFDPKTVERPGERGTHRGGRAGSDPGAHTLTVEARINASQNDDRDIYTEQLLGPGSLLGLQQTARDRTRQRASLQVDYVRGLAGFRLESGYRGDLIQQRSTFYSETMDSTGVHAPDAHLNNTFEQSQTVHAVYVQLGRDVGPLGVQLGLRAEAAESAFTPEQTGDTYQNRYFSLFPSAFLSYRMGTAGVLRANYSRRINRPRTRLLNPVPSYSDPLNLSVGNPILRPEYTDAFEVGAVRYVPWGSLTITPYFRRTTDVVRSVQTLREDGVTVRTFENLAERSSYGLELVSSLDADALFEGLRGYVSVEGFRVVTDGGIEEDELQNDAFGWGGRLNATYSMRSGLDLQSSLRYRAAMATEQGRRGARTWLNLGLRHRLFDGRGSLSVSARDPFGWSVSMSEIDIPRLYQRYERTPGALRVEVSFTYNLGGDTSR